MQQWRKVDKIKALLSPVLALTSAHILYIKSILCKRMPCSYMKKPREDKNPMKRKKKDAIIFAIINLTNSFILAVIIAHKLQSALFS